MAIASYIRDLMNSKDASVIRKMFEEGSVLKKQFGAENVYDFSIGNPDLEPPAEFLAGISEEALKQCKGSHGYMPNAGYWETRCAMAKKVSEEQGVSVTGDQVVMSVGAAGALNVVFKAILSPGDEVIVPAPFFAEYTHYVHNYGGILKPVKTLSDFSLDVDGIKTAVTDKTVAVLINSPNNPTGKIYDGAEIHNLAKALEEQGKKYGKKPYLICDEPYRDIVYDGKEVPAVFPVYSNSVVVSSFAKNLSIPGERIGYIAVNPSCEDASEFVAACVFTTRILGFVNAPAFFQRVIAKYWNVKKDLSSYRERRDEFIKIFQESGIDFFVPEGAFYFFCKVPESARGDDDKDFCDFLKKYRILCAPGTGFGRSGWFRISYCTSMDTIHNCKPALKQAVHDWKKNI